MEDECFVEKLDFAFAESIIWIINPKNPRSKKEAYQVWANSTEFSTTASAQHGALKRVNSTKWKLRLKRHMCVECEEAYNKKNQVREQGSTDWSKFWFKILPQKSASQPPEIYVKFNVLSKRTEEKARGYLHKWLTLILADDFSFSFGNRNLDPDSWSRVIRSLLFASFFFESLKFKRIGSSFWFAIQTLKNLLKSLLFFQTLL